MKVNRDDLIYTAGIIDGEGHIGLNHRNNKRQIKVVVGITNTDKKLMKWLENIWGHKAYPHNNNRIVPNCKPLYQWVIQDSQAIEMIKAIRPYLKLKTEKASLAMAYWDLHEQYGLHRGIRPPQEYYEKTKIVWEKIRELNKRGNNSVE